MKIKISEITDKLEMINAECECWYNPRKKEFFFTGSYGNSYDSLDLTEDQIDELYMESIPLPTGYEINEYSIMEEFIETINDNRLHNQLLIAINGSGAFRRFKDTCINFEIIEDWYKFKNEKYKEIAINWCRNNGIEYEEV